jgi:bacterioferritin
MGKNQFLQGLNDDLAAEWGTVIRYTYQAGKSFGILGAELREMLQREVQDELGHATFLTDVIIDLGGEPATAPKEFAKPDGLKAMLQLDLEMELAVRLMRRGFGEVDFKSGIQVAGQVQQD